MVLEDSHRWLALYLECFQEGTRTLVRLGCMLPAEEVHCWLGQHIHRRLLQGGSPPQQQDSQLEGNHLEHGGRLILLLLEEHYLVALVERWLMVERASVLEVSKVEDPDRVQQY